MYAANKPLNANGYKIICHAKKEPVFITKNGYGDLVIMSIETYEALLEERELDAAIAEAEAEYTAVYTEVESWHKR
ncbi:MAG: type II toxin-antitoxin system prevent-host-death family antitoxin [Bacillota bacterium]